MKTAMIVLLGCIIGAAAGALTAATHCKKEKEISWKEGFRAGMRHEALVGMQDRLAADAEKLKK